MPKSKKKWFQKVAETSNAMDVPDQLFKQSPKKMAEGLKQAVLESNRTKGTKFQSAMSMLNLYKNRGGKGLSPERQAALEKAKIELRKVFGKIDSSPRSHGGNKKS